MDLTLCVSAKSESEAFFSVLTQQMALISIYAAVCTSSLQADISATSCRCKHDLERFTLSPFDNTRVNLKLKATDTEAIFV